MLEGLLGLRRVRELLPGNEDVIRGIAGIQAALGEAVPQRSAARALGVSHPELSKLVTAKKLTTIDNARGKSQIAVASLIELIEAEEIAPREQPTWKKRRDETQPEPEKNLEQILTMRALAYHRALARNLDKAMVQEARSIVAEWRDSEKLSPDQADEWEKVLELPVADVAARMTDYSDAGKALRAASPFSAMGRREGDSR